MHAHGSTPFGDRLKRARKERGFSGTAFCKRVGILPCMLGGYENRGVMPRVDVLIAIAQTLGCSLDWLCGLAEK